MCDSGKPDKIDLNNDDLPDVNNSNKIVIDLDDLPVEDSATKAYPGLSNPSTPQFSKGSKASVSNVFWHLALAGLIGGVIGWAFTEIFMDDTYDIYQTYAEVLVEMSIFAALIGGAIGSCLGAVEGITSQVSQKTYRGIAVGLAFGFGGGAAGGFLGQIIYSMLGGGYIVNLIPQLFIRSIAWGLVGLFIGLGQGIGSGGGKKTTNGLLGGLVGGLVGGFLFDIIGLAADTGTISRAVAIPIIGASTGLGISLVQEIRKEAWLKVLQGATTGKEYIIFGDKTLIGSSPKCDIVLVKDNSVKTNHAEIRLENGAYIINDLNSPDGVWLNNARVSNQRLKNGDNLRIGNYSLQYFERGIKEV